MCLAYTYYGDSSALSELLRHLCGNLYVSIGLSAKCLGAPQQIQIYNDRDLVHDILEKVPILGHELSCFGWSFR